jgi:hypothetical protein
MKSLTFHKTGFTDFTTSGRELLLASGHKQFSGNGVI